MPDWRATSILVIGYGNTLRRDDALGCLVAEAVERWQRPAVRAISVPQLTPELAAELAPAAAAIFVDAQIRTPGSDIAVRTERLLPVDGESATLIHAMTPNILLGLCQAVFGVCPCSWQVVVPGADFSFGEGLSPLAERSMEQAIGMIDALIGRAGYFEPGDLPECPQTRLSSSEAGSGGFRT